MMIRILFFIGVMPAGSHPQQTILQTSNGDWASHQSCLRIMRRQYDLFINAYLFK